MSKGIGLAADSVRAVTEQVRRIINDRRRAVTMDAVRPRTESTASRSSRDEILGLVQRRFGALKTTPPVDVGSMIGGVLGPKSSSSLNRLAPNYGPTRLGMNEAFSTPTTPGKSSSENSNLGFTFKKQP
jgi:hypothetical protein